MENGCSYLIIILLQCTLSFWFMALVHKVYDKRGWTLGDWAWQEAPKENLLIASMPTCYRSLVILVKMGVFVMSSKCLMKLKAHKFLNKIKVLILVISCLTCLGCILGSCFHVKLGIISFELCFWNLTVGTRVTTLNFVKLWIRDSYVVF